MSWVCGNHKFGIGNCIRVKFWSDHWCGSSPLNQSFPTPFEVEINKHETVVELWDQTVGSGSWELNFWRAFNDWELDLVTNMQSTVQKQRVTSELEKSIGKGWEVIVFQFTKLTIQGIAFKDNFRAHYRVSCQGHLGALRSL